MSRALLLTTALRERLGRLAAVAYPGEACGVLIGSDTSDENGATTVRVESVEDGRNLDRSRTLDSYELDPGDLVRAERSARTAGFEVVGFWHSHPDAAATPSPRDAREAWPNASYLILSIGCEGVRELRSWCREGDRLCEEVVL